MFALWLDSVAETKLITVRSLETRHVSRRESEDVGFRLAEFKVDLLRMRTREGMAVARAKGRLKGRKPKLTTKQQTELRRMHSTGDYTITDLAELFNICRPTVYRTLAAVETVGAQRSRR